LSYSNEGSTKERQKAENIDDVVTLHASLSRHDNLTLRVWTELDGRPGIEIDIRELERPMALISPFPTMRSSILLRVLAYQVVLVSLAVKAIAVPALPSNARALESDVALAKRADPTKVGIAWPTSNNEDDLQFYRIKSASNLTCFL
jgi:hypothetical protein